MFWRTYVVPIGRPAGMVATTGDAERPAGMVATIGLVPTSVAAADCAVTTVGMPVPTPSELVSVR
jgi:hypothetical protein